MRKLLAFLLILGACAAPTGADIDLRDPDVLASIGASPVSDIRWSRPVGHFELLGTTASADPNEVAVLSAGVSELPESWTIEPAQLLRVSMLGPAAEGFEAAAEAVGPNIRLGDTTFQTQGRPTQRFELTRVIAHELAHIDQYDTLSAEYLDLLLAGELDEIRLWEGSTLIRDFAEATGWIDTSDEASLPTWELPGGSTAATPYGRTNPAEDMAESVALAVIGQGNRLDRPRQRWVEDYLDESIAALSDGKPFVPDGASGVEGPDELYDQTAARLAASPFVHEEPMYFRLAENSPALEILALEIEDELSRRELDGFLQRDDSLAVPRFVGLFTRNDGVRFWVEVIDFRQAPQLVSGPPVPLLTYVVFW